MDDGEYVNTIMVLIKMSVSNIFGIIHTDKFKKAFAREKYGRIKRIYAIWIIDKLSWQKPDWKAILIFWGLLNFKLEKANQIIQLRPCLHSLNSLLRLRERKYRTIYYAKKYAEKVYLCIRKWTNLCGHIEIMKEKWER